MASAIDNGSSSTADNMVERAHFDADGRVIRPAQITAGVVKFAELMASPELLRPMMRDYLTPYDMARLSRSCVAFHATCQPVLPTANPFTMLTEFGKDAPRLREMLESNNKSVRHGALDWLYQWGEQVSPERPFGKSIATQMLGTLRSWQFTEVEGETQCSEFVKDAYFAEQPGAYELADGHVQRHALGDDIYYQQIVQDNELAAVMLGRTADGNLGVVINERCRPWLWLPDSEERTQLIGTLVVGLQATDATIDTGPALIAFLRQDPRREDPGFAEGLAEVLVVDRALRSPDFDQGLTAMPGGIPQPIVEDARRRAVASLAAAQTQTQTQP